MATLADTLTAARTPLYHLHAASAQGDTGDALERCALVDLCGLPRLGLRGRDAASQLQQRGLTLPERPNHACWQPDDSLVARLSASEYLLLASPASGAPGAADETGWPLTLDGCHVLPRQDSHGWFALTGRQAPHIMAKLCGVDLAPEAFAPGCVAQTSVARSSAIVINASRPALVCFHLLFDSALAHYLWPVLLDAMQEFDGREASPLALRR